MRTIVVFFLIFKVVNISAQQRVFKSPKKETAFQYKEAYLWEAYPLNGNIIFGVAPTKEEAMNTIEEFTSNNKGAAIEPVHPIIKKGIATTVEYFDTFKSYCPKGYRILKLIDISALRIIKLDGLKKAAIYYSKNGEKSYAESMEYLSNLYNNFRPYRFPEKISREVTQNTLKK